MVHANRPIPVQASLARAVGAARAAMAYYEERIAEEMRKSMESMRSTTAEWGVFHAFIAQFALGHPIFFAMPQQDSEEFHALSLNEMIDGFLEGQAQVPKAPGGVPLYVLPTKAKTQAPGALLQRMTHFILLLPIKGELEAKDADAYEESFHAEQRALEIGDHQYKGTGQTIIR